MYEPSLHYVMLIATLPVLIGFAIVDYKVNIYSVATWILLLMADVLVLTAWLPWRFQYLYDKKESKPEPIDERPTQASPKLIPRLDGQQVYSQSMPKLKIDCVAKFNQTLITQRNGNLKVDMSEGFWLKTKEGMEETEWKRIGGEGPTEFRTMLARGEKLGAYKRDGGQGRWIPHPDGWQKIRRLANGEGLPQ